MNSKNNVNNNTGRILKYFYPILPSMVRIRSESLCLDHTFFPDATMKCVSYDDLIELLKSKYIDSVWAFIPKDSEAYYICPITKEKLFMYGWTDLSEFSAAESYT